MAFPHPLQSLWGNKKAHERPSWAAYCGVTGSEQMCRHQEGAVPVVSNPGYCSPHLLGQSPVCLIRAGALHSTGTTPINSTVLLPGSWCFHKGLQAWESCWELEHHGPSHKLKHWAARKLRTTSGGDFHSQLNTTYQLPAHTAPGRSASCQVSLQPLEHLLKQQGSCFAFEWYLGLQGWLKCNSLTAVPCSTSTAVQSEQFPGLDYAQALVEVPALQVWHELTGCFN